MKPPVIRQVTSLHVGCDRIGNTLLLKLSCLGAKDVVVLLPASIAFWLLRHIPVNQNPHLAGPATRPTIEQHEWDDTVTARVLTVQCKQFADGLRMTMLLDRKPDIGVLLDAVTLELMRRMLEAYRHDLIDMDAG